MTRAFLHAVTIVSRAPAVFEIGCVLFVIRDKLWSEKISVALFWYGFLAALSLHNISYSTSEHRNKHAGICMDAMFGLGSVT